MAKVYIPQITSPNVWATVGGSYLESFTSWRMNNWATALKIAQGNNELSMDKYKAEIKARSALDTEINRQIRDLENDIDSLAKEDRSEAQKIAQFNATKRQQAENTNARIAQSAEQFNAGQVGTNQRFIEGQRLTNERQKKGITAANMRAGFEEDSGSGVEYTPVQGGSVQELVGSVPDPARKAKLESYLATYSAMPEGPEKTKGMAVIEEEAQKAGGVAGVMEGEMDEETTPVEPNMRARAGTPQVGARTVGASTVKRTLVPDPLGRVDENGKPIMVSPQVAALAEKTVRLELLRGKQQAQGTTPKLPQRDLLEDARSVYEGFEKLPQRERKATMEQIAALRESFGSVRSITDPGEMERARVAFLTENGFTAPPTSPIVTPKTAVVTFGPWDNDVQDVVRGFEGKDKKLERVLATTTVGNQARKIVDAAGTGQSPSDLGKLVAGLEDRYPDDPQKKTVLKGLVAAYGTRKGLRFEPVLGQEGVDVPVPPTTPQYRTNPK